MRVNKLLEELRLERSNENPFASKVDFFIWADAVKAALADDERARRQFANHVATAETMYAFKSSPLDAINNAIGLVNELIAARHSAAWQSASIAPCQVEHDQQASPGSEIPVTEISGRQQATPLRTRILRRSLQFGGFVVAAAASAYIGDIALKLL